jgi:heme-binding NEAT domain protein
MAYHPADKTFGGFSGVNMTFDGIVEQTQQQAPPQEAPKPKGTLPKGTVQTSPPQSSSTENTKPRKEHLESYEKDYLERIEQDRIADEKAYQEIIEAEAKSQAKQSRGSLPKGFEVTSEPKAPKPSKGTLPKGF